GGFARFPRIDRPGQPKSCVTPEHFPTLFPRRQTQVNVQVPLSNTQGNALVQLFFGEARRGGKHRPDQCVVLPFLFVQKRSWMFRVETKSRLPRVSIVSEVLHLRGEVGKEYLVAVFQRYAVILVSLQRLSCSDHDLISASLVFHVCVSQRSKSRVGARISLF